ncbi:MAG: DUF4131 domain-containing protein [Clostridia bacterium]|jgi:competence protein ComEC|nr:DUF4131 domain-containing protein [Clostridia bacterium]
MITSIYILIIKYQKTKKLFRREAIILMIIVVTIGYLNIKNKENNFNNKYKDTNKIEAIVKVKSNIKESEYSKSFTGKLVKNYSSENITNTKLNIKFNSNIQLNKGDIVKLIGEYEDTNYYKNEGNFNYRNYLKKDNIYGNLKVSKIEIVKKNNNIINNLNIKIKEKIKNNYSNQTANFIETIILGDKTNLLDTVKEEFSNSGLSHLLAISGMHIAIIILISNAILDHIIKNYKIKNILLLLIIIIYATIINLSSSSARAIIMAILHIISKLIYKKDNFLVNISLASLILLIINPYNLIDSGFQLSFIASLGIVIILPKIEELEIKNKILKYIYVSLLVSISANILILPIIINTFKKTSLSMFLIQIIITPILYIIEILGLATIVIPSQLVFVIKPILEISVSIFNYISQINFFTIYTKVPKPITITIYYLSALVYIIKPKRKFIIQICKKTIILLLILNLTISIINQADTNLKIYMIDVGQGDSTLIITPENKKILIDGGGLENYDIGEKVLIPYLLNKQIKTLDYVTISHFDRDHVRRNNNINPKTKSEKYNNLKTKRRQ